MREIRFRAWRKEEKRMIYLANNMGSQTHLQLNNHSWGVFEPDSDDYYGIASANSNLGDILMQYTGLKDKNGTDIYEGDIVRSPQGAIQRVYYSNQFAAFLCADIYRPNAEIRDTWIVEKEDEIIGNLYENPELLEGRE